MDGSCPVKVLYFTRDDSVHDRRFLATMVDSGMKVFLLRLQGDSSPLCGLPRGAEEVRWQQSSPFTGDEKISDRVKKLQKIIHDIQPDLIHAGPLTDCARTAALSGFQPLVSMSWGSDILAAWQWNFHKKKNLQHTLKRSTILIGDCQAVKQKAISLGFPEGRIVTFPWGVDLRRFSPGSGTDLRKEWGYKNEFVILSLRSWEPIYGMDMVVKAFLISARKNLSLRLLLGGTGSQEEKIHRLVRERGMEDRVHFLGKIPQEELPKIYRASDLYVSASHCDGSSVSLMEAMACGIPVLVSDISGNREWVTEGDNGWLFRDGNIQQMASLITSMPMKKGTLKNMGLNNRKLALKKADWKKNSQGLVKAYKMAMKLKGPA
jgi:glycosyltransferase involved in cell wall biosynthesis